MKKTSKWPSRVFNLLMVLAMVISLSAILVAPPVAAQELTATCNPTPVYDGCHLEVAVNTYIKTAAGDFIPQSTFSPGDPFYVNAVVVNNGNTSDPAAAAVAPINATISFPDGDVGLSAAEGGMLTKSWPLGNLTYASPEGIMADFWWKVQCLSASGNDTIVVTATSASDCTGEPAVGNTTVFQGLSLQNKCLDIEIVEAPGMGNKTGHLGNYYQTMPDTINPCTNFGIKAEITNRCNETLYDVRGSISWTGSADGPVGGDPVTWTVGSLAPGETKAVGWTLHCNGAGDVVVTVTAPNNESITNYIDDPWTVHQTTPGGLVVTILQPTQTTDCTGNLTPIKQPTGECGPENFPVIANVHNSGDAQVGFIYAFVGASPNSGWVKLPTPAIAGPFSLLPGGDHQVTFNMKCIGNGTGNITVTASGTDLSTGQAVNSQSDYSDTRWWVTINQQNTIASYSPDPAFAVPAEVNKCQDFSLVFRYFNYSGVAWNDPATGNITACIKWKGISSIDPATGEIITGNATLVDSVSFRRIPGFNLPPNAWQPLSGFYGNPLTPETTYDAVTGVYTSCVHIPVICACCGAEVQWNFQCTDVGQVQFYSTFTVQQTSPITFNDSDTSETVCVNQVWKAHLISDNFFFVQSANGVMMMQDAVEPGTFFHVVIPVMNTGDAAAENVQVYFELTDAPEAPCTKSFSLVSSSGDGSVAYNPLTGIGIASFGEIPGHTAVKAVLLLQCLCEGTVTAWIPDAVPAAGWGGLKGIRGTDANTGEAIPQANMEVPPCPRILEQIPFTVVIENPYTCQSFSQGTTFPVKAKITNGASEDLVDVMAELSIIGNATLLNGQNNPKLVGNITSGSYTEITWELQCTGGGEVRLGVTATSTTPLLTAHTINWPDTVNVHQIAVPRACLSVTILSPDEHQSDNPDNHGHPMIATGQQFAVSAKVANYGTANATNVVATIYPSGCNLVVLDDAVGESGQGRYVSLAPGETGNRTYDTIVPGDFEVATFTLVGGGTSDWGLKDCSVRTADICVNATTDTQISDPCNYNASDNVEVSIYPAAFLVATIGNITPSTSIPTGSLFTVNYTITNYGVADATSVVATLSADGKVGPAAGTGGFTKALGTVPGWGWGDANSVEGSFQLQGTLQGTQTGLSTLTITPFGDDECGWQPVLGWTTWSPSLDGSGTLIKEDTNVQWVQRWGTPIYSEFLVPASETVNQLASGQLDLALTKTVDNAFPTAGQTVNFTIKVTNNGPAAASGVKVSDTLPAGLTFVSATASQGSWSAPVWTVGSLVNGGSASLVIKTTATTTNPITNTASITAVDQLDPITSNNSASVTLNQPAVTSMNIALNSGWNLISLPLIPNNGNITALFSGLPVDAIWSYSGGTWNYYGDGVLTALADGKGYWVHMTAAATLTGSGIVNPLPPNTPPTYGVAAGWNMIGFKSTSAMTASDYLGGVSWVRIWSFVNGGWTAVQSGDMMQPGLGYWIAATSAGTIFP